MVERELRLGEGRAEAVAVARRRRVVRACMVGWLCGWEFGWSEESIGCCSCES